MIQLIHRYIVDMIREEFYMMKEMLQDMGISPDDAEQLYNAPILDFIDWILKNNINKEKGDK